MPCRRFIVSLFAVALLLSPLAIAADESPAPRVKLPAVQKIKGPALDAAKLFGAASRVSNAACSET